MDLELYEYVKVELGENQRSSYGPGFQKDLERHRSINSLPKMRKKDELDYRTRICFEKITGLIRRINGLPSKGSY